jgi:hypothetical protein
MNLRGTYNMYIEARFVNFNPTYSSRLNIEIQIKVSCVGLIFTPSSFPTAIYYDIGNPVPVTQSWDEWTLSSIYCYPVTFTL